MIPTWFRFFIFLSFLFSFPIIILFIGLMHSAQLVHVHSFVNSFIFFSFFPGFLVIPMYFSILLLFFFYFLEVLELMIVFIWEDKSFNIACWNTYLARP